MNDYYNELLEIFSNQTFEDFVARRNLFCCYDGNSSQVFAAPSPLSTPASLEEDREVSSTSRDSSRDSWCSSSTSTRSSFSVSPREASDFSYYHGGVGVAYADYARDLRIMETPSMVIGTPPRASPLPHANSMSPAPTDAIPAMLSRLSSAVVSNSQGDNQPNSPAMVITSPTPPKSPDTPKHPPTESHRLKKRPVGIKRSAQNRLVWTKNLHNLFIRALATLGNNAMPKAILAYMGVDGLTRENISSHLQKHRLRLQRNELKRSRKAALAAEAKKRQNTDAMFSQYPPATSRGPLTSSFIATLPLSPTPSPTSSDEEYPSSDDEDFVEYYDDTPSNQPQLQQPIDFSATSSAQSTRWCSDNSIAMYNTPYNTFLTA